MKKIFLIFASILFIGWTNTTGLVVNIDDDKSNSIRQHYENYLNNDVEGLKSLWSPDLQVFLNSVDAISLDELVGLLEAQHSTYSISMQWGTDEDTSYWVETTDYPGADSYNPATVTQTWFNWIATSKLTGETITMPAHISFFWGEDGKIAQEYHMYDTAAMIAGIEAAQLAASE